MADGVDIDLYSDDIDQNFGQMKVCTNITFILFNQISCNQSYEWNVVSAIFMGSF